MREDKTFVNYKRQTLVTKRDWANYCSDGTKTATKIYVKNEGPEKILSDTMERMKAAGYEIRDFRIDLTFRKKYESKKKNEDQLYAYQFVRFEVE